MMAVATDTHKDEHLASALDGLGQLLVNRRSDGLMPSRSG